MATPAFNLNKASVNRFKANLERVSKKISGQAAGALFLDAQEILTRSRQEFVPVDRGILQGDSGVEKPRNVAGRWVVEIWYGAGPAQNYAVAVHEHPSGHSPKSWKGGVTFSKGGPKYLERPVLEYEGTMLRSIGARIRF